MRSLRPRHLTALVVLTTLLVAAAPPAAAKASPGRSDGYHRVGYFTQWGIYGRAFPVKKLDTSGAASRLTHVNYAFGNVSEDGRCYVDGGPGEGDAWADYQRPVPAQESVDGVADAWGEPLNGNFGQLAKLKAKHPGLKVMISLGGWSWSTYFSNAARTDASRRAFVASCIDLYLRGNLPILDGGSGGPGAAAGVFDGIDLDWEWPNWPGEAGNVIRPEDRENFTKLLAEFRRQLDAYGRQTRRHHPLTAFLPANPAAMDAGYEGREIFRYLDFATVQGYDFHGTWEAVTNQQSALRVPKGAPDDPDFSVEVAVDGWIARGAPRHKLVLGIPYYGQGWTGVTGGGDGLFQPATGPAPATHAAGFEDYKQLKNLARDGFTVHRDLRAGHAWLFDGTTFWTYDDPVVVLQKTLYIRRTGLGGAMIWSLDGDDDHATLTRTISLGLTTR
ncbi:glycoside hydrolase family 18 protein [Verrucosispora sioxanthis]|uniref:chitinase n=1 Tax=Verrucosispora sioxanthis TaxID=2499994 RepID=A0A6M1L9Y7_9ACTN|nr:glycoside hydrolase family 18 protein [Verrucosispora sioxanthis]NEE65972.1 glycoside hydrolase family 18 protein [Verrucosispora sioxanthis]NGM15082.1 glycoside hydrolase family 18 protein [Verrucosispora sioxanthis]